MATDFFENQDRARKKTGRLVAYFALAVLAIVAMLYALAVLVIGYQGQDPSRGTILWDARWWSPELLLQVGALTVALVAGGSLFKIAQLRGGGKTVAEGLGGVLVHSDARDPVRRQLLNVVEEMAIASGISPPPVYLLADEDGINAFAAGFSPADAVIGVTRGCVERLDRDELQGVIAHEFSHILNGDMRLNIRLIGVVHGILLIGIVGYGLLRSAAMSGRTRSRNERGNAGAVLLAVGSGLMLVGFLGTFFGNLIKASVSRQREFLADASAVQYTRNPSGIAGALKKIGGLAAGSLVAHPSAPEVSHMFFGRGIAPGFSNLFATHPPLEERIRRLDPGFDASGRPARGGETGKASSVAAGFAAAAAEPAIGQVGEPTSAHLALAQRLIESLPPVVIESVHEAYGARAVVYALLLAADPGIRSVQLERLDAHADPGVRAETRRLLPHLDGVAAAARLPLVDMAVPALRGLTRAQYAGFVANVRELMHADQKIDVFEWTLQRVLLRHVSPEFFPVQPPRARHGSLDAVAPHCSVALSMLAHAGGRSADAARHAFELGARDLALFPLAFLPASESGLAQFDAALTELCDLAPLLKEPLLHACAVVVAADGEVNVREAELLRATADSLGCPMPPLLPGQTLL